MFFEPTVAYLVVVCCGGFVDREGFPWGRGEGRRGQ